MQFKMKQMFGVVLLSVMSNVYAVDYTCPPSGDIRSKGQFVNIYNLEGDRWMLTSNPFSYGHNVWYVEYLVNLPGAKNISKAMSEGQESFNHSYLLREPTHDFWRARIVCKYTSPNQENIVLAMTGH